ncbi:hypothetical protein B4110_1883 [Parageobacillus toebii]|uniref:Uncharacterized protein n=1 Tax=Parageobacillus toebii TaxID=153151 RepID=A0A150MEJ0_9BACL|nr:hypothetical protein B4110_1883 [Parageobacillus toebii]
MHFVTLFFYNKMIKMVLSLFIKKNKTIIAFPSFLAKIINVAFLATPCIPMVLFCIYLNDVRGEAYEH